MIGGEACIWSEFVDGGSISQRVFPRASAMAERLWSSAQQTDTVEAARRLGEFRCRLLRRGVQARPVNGPDFCPGEDDADWPGVQGSHRLQGLSSDQTFIRDQAYKKWIGDVGRVNAMK